MMIEVCFAFSIFLQIVYNMLWLFCYIKVTFLRQKLIKKMECHTIFNFLENYTNLAKKEIFYIFFAYL